MALELDEKEVGAFEIGDPSLDSERALNVSASLDYTGSVFEASATVYYTEFTDFIYEQATGAEEDELPVFQFMQDDVTFQGLDLEASATFARWDSGRAGVRGLLDMVEAKLDVSGDSDLPRIPPMRYGAGLFGVFGPVSASVDFVRVSEQDETAVEEIRTGGYEDLRAFVGIEVPFRYGSFGAFLSGRNLTDDEQRHHVSFIKDFAPAPGRSIEAGVRLVF